MRHILVAIKSKEILREHFSHTARARYALIHPEAIHNVLDVSSFTAHERYALHADAHAYARIISSTLTDVIHGHLLANDNSHDIFPSSSRFIRIGAIGVTSHSCQTIQGRNSVFDKLAVNVLAFSHFRGGDSSASRRTEFWV